MAKSVLIVCARLTSDLARSLLAVFCDSIALGTHLDSHASTDHGIGAWGAVVTSMALAAYGAITSIWSLLQVAQDLAPGLAVQLCSSMSRNGECFIQTSDKHHDVSVSWLQVGLIIFNIAVKGLLWYGMSQAADEDRGTGLHGRVGHYAMDVIASTITLSIAVVSFGTGDGVWFGHIGALLIGQLMLKEGWTQTNRALRATGNSAKIEGGKSDL